MFVVRITNLLFSPSRFTLPQRKPTPRIQRTRTLLRSRGRRSHTTSMPVYALQDGLTKGKLLLFFCLSPELTLNVVLQGIENIASRRIVTVLVPKHLNRYFLLLDLCSV